MTIRFQMTRERTGRHTGPRYRRVKSISQGRYRRTALLRALGGAA